MSTSGDTRLAAYILGRKVETEATQWVEQVREAATETGHVLIDPNDTGQVERLTTLMYHAQNGIVGPTNGDVQTALRLFAKPDEPLAMAAVVEDADGRHWVRAAPAMDSLPRPWHSGKDAADYAGISVVAVLTEGVSPA